LFILRKETINFITKKLKSIKSIFEPKEIIDIIINNYGYINNLKELNYDEHNIFNRYYLDDDLIYRLK
jgi:hypothetical protein